MDFMAEVTNGSASEIKIVHLNGELDEVGIEALKQTVDPLLMENELKTLIFDFSNLRFINSKGIGYLVSVHTHLSKDGKILTLASANEAVMDVISLVGLTSIIPYFSTVEQALANN